MHDFIFCIRQITASFADFNYFSVQVRRQEMLNLAANYNNSRLTTLTSLTQFRPRPADAPSAGHDGPDEGDGSDDDEELSDDDDSWTSGEPEPPLPAPAPVTPVLAAVPAAGAVGREEPRGDSGVAAAAAMADCSKAEVARAAGQGREPQSTFDRAAAETGGALRPPMGLGQLLSEQGAEGGPQVWPRVDKSVVKVGSG